MWLWGWPQPSFARHFPYFFFFLSKYLEPWFINNIIFVRTVVGPHGQLLSIYMINCIVRQMKIIQLGTDIYFCQNLLLGRTNRISIIVQSSENGWHEYTSHIHRSCNNFFILKRSTKRIFLLQNRCHLFLLCSRWTNIYSKSVFNSKIKMVEKK